MINLKADLCKASLIFLWRPSLDTRFCSLEIVPEDWNYDEQGGVGGVDYSLLTVLLILFQVSFSLNTEELVKAAQTWRTPLKLWRHRQISATAAHFSEGETVRWGGIWENSPMISTLEVMQGLITISDTIRRQVCST